jgi:hypothetical protein
MVFFLISHALGTHIKRQTRQPSAYVFHPLISIWLPEDKDGYAGTSHFVNYSQKVEN